MHAPEATCTLLHNMSCRPQAPVQRTGTHRCRAVYLCGQCEGRWPRYPGDYARLREIYGIDLPKDGDTWAAFMELAAKPIPMLALLPPVASVRFGVVPGSERIPGITDDPLVILAIVARCAGQVFIRDRPPALASPPPLGDLTLIAPLSWTPPR